MPKRASSLLIALAAPAACALASEAPETTTTQAIRGGEAESGMPAVGLVTFGSRYCTGTLIAPDVVLTAAHCITSAPTTFLTTEGTPVATRAHAVAEKKPYPSWTPLGCPNPTRDVALLRLAEPITNVDPVPFGAPPSRGETCTAAGFGRHGAVERRKRSGTSRIDDVIGNTVRVTWGDALAHAGDSGSPLLCDDVIVATASCHNDGDGATHQVEYYQRIDHAKSWIDATLTEWRAR
ncbi:MAG: S1 family peptidase [Labilithrix sp.]|nr:S1 family peptidase [Labilithrix sp.]MCW5812273.1 S1 family peptidase [Labilithrix sp.]